MGIEILNRGIDFETSYQFIEGMDIDVSGLDDKIILQHTHDHDGEYWNLRWSGQGRSMITEYGIDCDPEFEDALYRSLKALNMDDSLSKNIDLLVQDGENTAVYHCGFENIYDGMNFGISAGEMLRKISSEGNQSNINHGTIEYFEIMTDNREFIWENRVERNDYGILGRTPVNKADLYILSTSIPSNEEARLDLNEVRRKLRAETSGYKEKLE